MKVHNRAINLRDKYTTVSSKLKNVNCFFILYLFGIKKNNGFGKFLKQKSVAGYMRRFGPRL